MPAAREERFSKASTPLFLVVLFATSFFWTAFDLMEFDGKVIALLVGASLLVAAIGIERSGRRRVRLPGDGPADAHAALCCRAGDAVVHGYYTGEHFADSVGWPLALIGFGIFMIAMSAAAFRIDRDYVRRAR